MYRRVIELAAEVLEAAEHIKPSQYAKREVLARKGLLGTKLDEWVTAIMYAVYKRLGIIDEIIRLCFGDEEYLRTVPCFVRQLYRIIVNEVYFDRRSETKMEEITRKILSSRGYAKYAEDTRRLIHFAHTFVPPECVDIFDEIFWKLNFPKWFAKRLAKLLGSVEEAVKLIKIWNSKAPLSIRVNSLKTTPEELKERLWKKYRVYIEYGKFTKYILKIYGSIPFNRCEEFEQGLFIVQDEASALVGYILGPRPGETVLDLCAAPGGKTTHIGELMKNTGKIVAVDVSKLRMERLIWQCKRLDINIVEPVLLDGRQVPARYGQIFDKVLVDAPCTSSGTIRKNPEVRWLLKEEEISEYAKLQKELLVAGLEAAKHGAVVVYATCSVFVEENEQVIKYVLDKGLAELEEIAWPEGVSRGITEIDEEMKKCIRLWTHLHDTTSFFVAKLRKT
ncbi:MAG: RsmB/NOP family class I SAM-dependent RNA methyltransferase [bacterium]|nr:RsmB/NOP family class I SAM-dependent RNA methyltransferase [bacterium]